MPSEKTILRDLICKLKSLVGEDWQDDGGKVRTEMEQVGGVVFIVKEFTHGLGEIDGRWKRA